MGFSSTLFGAEKPRGQHRAQRPATDSPTWWPITVGSVLLAVDPSIARCGFALLAKTDRDPIRLDSGIIYPAGDDIHDRYDDLAAQLTRKIRPVRFNGADYAPTDAVVEIPFGIGEGGRSMLDYARAVGVCECVCWLGGVSVNRVRANVWKKGKSKSDTRRECKLLFDYEPRDDNEADAIMLGAWLCWR